MTMTCLRFRDLESTQRVTSGPYAEPMHIAEAKLQVRQGQSITTEDPIFASLVTNARNAVESDTSRALVYQTRTLTLDEWPDRIELYACPVRSVSITYTDTAGDAQTLATSVYKTRLDLEPATITLKSGQYWPSLLGESGSITVTMVCGYAVPFTVSSNTLTFQGFAPTNGDIYRLSNSGGVLPGGLNTTTDYYVVSASGSTCSLSLTSGGSAIALSNVGSGTHFLGVVPGWAMHAMRLLVARHYLDREGSMAASQCEASYLQAIRPGKYTFN